MDKTLLDFGCYLMYVSWFYLYLRLHQPERRFEELPGCSIVFSACYEIL